MPQQRSPPRAARFSRRRRRFHRAMWATRWAICLGERTTRCRMILSTKVSHPSLLGVGNFSKSQNRPAPNAGVWADCGICWQRGRRFLIEDRYCYCSLYRKQLRPFAHVNALSVDIKSVGFIQTKHSSNFIVVLDCKVLNNEDWMKYGVEGMDTDD